jgi:hypothetical protein
MKIGRISASKSAAEQQKANKRRRVHRTNIEYIQ